MLIAVDDLQSEKGDTRTPDFLCATEADLIGDDEATYDRALFPDHVSLGNTALPVTSPLAWVGVPAVGLPAVGFVSEISSRFSGKSRG